MSLSTFFQSGKARLLRHVRGAADPADRFTRIERQYRDILEQMKALNERVTEAMRRESQLRAVVTRDIELEDHLPSLEEILRDSRTSHIAH
ncbi:MAG: hypothetical protein ACRDF6_13455, partial [bacterium]